MRMLSFRRTLIIALIVAIAAYIGWILLRGKSEQAGSEPQKPDDQQILPRPSIASTTNPAFLTFDTAFAQQYQQIEETQYILTGTVVSDVGEVVAGASLSLYPQRPRQPSFEWASPTQSTRTDAAGMYEIRMNLPIKGYLVIKKTHYATVEDYKSMDQPGVMRKDYKLISAPVCVEGKITNEQGEPITAAIVWARNSPYSVDETEYWTSPLATTTTRTGEFAIEGLSEGRMGVNAYALGYERQARSIVAAKGPCTQIHIQLKAATVIWLSVRNRLGQPIADAEMRMLPATVGVKNLENPGTNTPGIIGLAIPPDISPFETTVSAKDYQSRSITIDPSYPKMEVILDDVDRIQGRVISETGQPVSGAGVRIKGASPSPKEGVPTTGIPMQEEIVTDAAGSFTGHVIWPPLSSISVTKAGFVERRLDFEEGSSMPRFIEIRIEKPNAGVFGQVVDELGEGMKRFSIGFSPVAGLKTQTQKGWMEHAFLRNVENGDGQFMIVDVPAGTYNLTFYERIPGVVRAIKTIENVEIKKGFLTGKLLVRVSK